MKNIPFLLLLLGIVFIWLGLTGRLGAVLAAIFEPGKLTATTSGGGAVSPVVVPPDSAMPEEPTIPDTAPELPEFPTPFDIIPGADVLPAV